MLPRLVGKARATEMMMLGERMPAAKALDWGLIHRAVADDALMAEALALAERLAAGPTVALGAMRRAARRRARRHYAEALAREAREPARARGTADAAEGGMAFLQKRKPAFKGALIGLRIETRRAGRAMPG